MSLLYYYRLVRTVLPKGVPLCFSGRLVAEGTSPFGAGSVLGGERAPWAVPVGLQGEPPGLALMPQLESPDGTFGRPRLASEWEHVFRVHSPSGPSEPQHASPDGRFYFEIPTDDLLGAYEVSLVERVGPTQGGGAEEGSLRQLLQAPGEILILEPEDYADLLREGDEEVFLPSPGLRGPEAVAEYVRRTIDERLEDDRFNLDPEPPDSNFSLKIEGQSPEEPLPSSPLNWTVVQFVDDFRQLALRGVRKADWTLTLSGESFVLTCSAKPLEPLTEGMVATVDDAGYLSALESSATFVHADLSVEKEGLVSGSDHYSLRMELRGFPVAGIVEHVG